MKLSDIKPLYEIAFTREVENLDWVHDDKGWSATFEYGGDDENTDDNANNGDVEEKEEHGYKIRLVNIYMAHPWLGDDISGTLVYDVQFCLVDKDGLELQQVTNMHIPLAILSIVYNGALKKLADIGFPPILSLSVSYLPKHNTVDQAKKRSRIYNNLAANTYKKLGYEYLYKNIRTRDGTTTLMSKIELSDRDRAIISLLLTGYKVPEQET